MFNPFICGSFHQQEEDDSWSLSSTARRSRKSGICGCNNRGCKNPYSMRGLDKFSTVLADLEERRQKIYAQMGSQDISLVRFVCSNSDEWVPIVVKFRDQKEGKTKLVSTQYKPVIHKSEALNNSVIQSLNKSVIQSLAGEKVGQTHTVSEGTTKKKSFSWNIMKFDRWRRPSSYLPIFIVLILLCLVMFGRSVAILCTAIGWYLLPTMKRGDSNLRRSMKKKYSRKLSEKQINL